MSVYIRAEVAALRQRIDATRREQDGLKNEPARQFDEERLAELYRHIYLARRARCPARPIRLQ